MSLSKTCKDCTWYDLTENVCYNSNSPHIRDVREPDEFACDDADVGDGREFHLVQSRHVPAEGKWWIELGEHPTTGEPAYVNQSGGCAPTTGYDVCATATAERWEDLDWSQSQLVVSEDGAGWLDREGRFYGCPREAHDMHARMVLKRDVRDLEDTGWVRIYHRRSYVYLKPMTPEQRTWLDHHGYERESDGHL